MNVRAFAAVALLLALPCRAAGEIEKAQGARAMGLIETLGTGDA